MNTLSRLAVVSLLALSTAGCSSLMRSTMVEERQSPYNMEDTVKTIVAQARQKGWNVGEPRRLDQSIRKHGGPVMLPVTLLELCEPHHAGKLLANDDDRWVSVFMPCTISVYEKSDGKVYVTNMKAGNVGGMMGGTVAEVMGGPVARDQEEILSLLRR
jgi:uncharacterized protein (DUF302 family)